GTLWRTADLAFARGDVDGAEAALRSGVDVLDEPRLERWTAHTLAGLAEVAVLRGEPAQAIELLQNATARYGTSDPGGPAAALQRIEELQRRRKDGPVPTTGRQQAKEPT